MSIESIKLKSDPNILISNLTGLTLQDNPVRKLTFKEESLPRNHFTII